MTTGLLRNAVRQATEAVERELIIQRLQARHWHRLTVAKDLGVSYKTILAKIKRYQLDGSTGLEAPPPCPERRIVDGQVLVCTVTAPHTVHVARVGDHFVTLT